MVKKYGIDVSSNQGVIDWDAVKASGVEFAIIRAGLGRTASQKDSQFERNYREARRVGIQLGAYWASWAEDEADAQREIDACLEVIAGKKFEYPIYYDVETDPTINQGADHLNRITKLWHDQLRKNGWYSGFYSFKWVVDNLLNPGLAFEYALWIAQWGPAECTYTGDFGMWQFTSEGRCGGINGDVDCDWVYKPYPDTIINGGWNGYSGNEKPAPAPAKKSNEEIAREVIRGEWGNNPERKARLTAAGYDYEAIQDIVDDLMRGEPDFVMYTVRPGDTLSEIAQKYGTTYQKIAADNGIKNPDLIYSGQVLKIY